MEDLKLLDCFQPELVNLERVRYFSRQLLTEKDMTDEAAYFRQKLRRHNRFLHGWGVVCGLEVKPAPTDDAPWQIEIGRGYALEPWGDEINVAKPVHIDLARCGPGAVTDPCEPDLLHTDDSASGGTLFVAIKYAECLASPVGVMPAGCACEEEACEYSRIRDSFQIECLTELPPSHQPDPGRPRLCDFISGEKLPLCPPCPADPWVVLAKITLPASPTTDIAEGNIDNFVKRQLYSTAVLQEELIKCCCAAADLMIEKKAIPIEDNSGVINEIRYDITVRNNGPSEAQNVIVTDTPLFNGRAAADRALGFRPSDEIWVESSPNLVATLGTLDKNGEAILGFSIKVAGLAGVYKNTATVSTDTFERDKSNNTDDVTTVVHPPPIG